MKIRFNAVAVSALVIASAMLSSAPASAQVAGIGTADPTIAIVRTKALAQGYQQVETTFASNNQLIMQKSKEINDINAQLDTNKDKTLTQAELDAAVKAKNPLLTQVQQKENEIQQLQEPIVKARLFVVDSLVRQFPAAQKKVAAAKKINFILTPDIVLWSPDAADITPALTAELDVAVPTVGITPPADWRPAQESGTIFQQIQQLMVGAARAQAAQAQQQQGAAPATGTPPATAPATTPPKPAEESR